MIKIPFVKMHGCGNDYVYIDARGGFPADPSKLAIALSDRHKSIGGDGVIFVCDSDTADSRMRMFNLDGSEGKMCGNGIRCVAKFTYDYGIAVKDVLDIQTESGIKTIRVTVKDGKVTDATVDMGAAILRPADIPAGFAGDTAIGVPLTVDGKEYAVTCVSMGNPHCVVFCDDPLSLDLPKIGPSFEHHAAFPEQVNTEFIKVIDDHTLQMRVWERGSGETMACGTGACAAAVAAVENGYCQKDTDITVHLLGGDLVIRYTDETVFMTGEAVTAFEGTVEYEE